MRHGISHNVTKLKRRPERKRKPIEGKVSLQLDGSGKRTRSDLASTSVGEEVCLFCGGAATEGNPLSRASTMELDSRVRAVAMEANDFKTESIRKSSNQWTKILYQNNLKYIAFFFTF